MTIAIDKKNLSVSSCSPNALQCTLTLIFGFLLSASLVVNMQNAYGHGCQAQGGCCTVGSACAEASITPLAMMFVATSVFGVMLFSFYGRQQLPHKICSCLNIFE